LVSPSRKSLKKHSYNVCLQRFDKKDELLLSSFFGPKENAGAYANAIELSKAEKFRTLHNFLSERTESTEFININLLAWMIDFQPRPYHDTLQIVENSVQPDTPRRQPNPGEVQPTNSLKPEEVIGVNGQVEVIKEEPPPKPSGYEGPTPIPKKKFDGRWLIGIVVLLIGGVVIWWLLPVNNCMYWDNNHYIATSCSVPRIDTPLVRLDPVKLRGFRRLHHVDTLTYYSVDKLWYVRVGGIIEVYSAYGKHPLYPDKKLAPLTYYAVNVCQKQHGY
jgi:hypothetical protein